MKTIIIPTDFSETSTNAAMYAADLACAIQANVTLIHVVSLPMTTSEMTIPAETIDLMMRDATKIINQLKSRIEQRTKNTIRVSALVRMGDFIEETRSIAAQTDLFAIVMGLQGTGAAERMLLGSNALAAIHRIPYPVIIIPADVHYVAVKNIAIACNMHDVNETLPVRDIEMLTNTFHSKLHVVYISKPGKKMKSEVLPEAISVQNDLSALDPEIHLLENDHVEAGLLAFVHDKKIDLLVMIPEKRNFISALFHKSISNEVALSAHLPIVNIHN